MRKIFLALLSVFAVAALPVVGRQKVQTKSSRVNVSSSKPDAFPKADSSMGVISDALMPPPPPDISNPCIEKHAEPGFDIKKYLAENLRYPPKARRKKLEGKVIMRFLVNEKGQVRDPTVERSVNKELDAEAVRLIQMMPRWKQPPMMCGRPIPQYYELYVLFKL